MEKELPSARVELSDHIRAALRLLNQDVDARWDALLDAWDRSSADGRDDLNRLLTDLGIAINMAQRTASATLRELEDSLRDDDYLGVVNGAAPPDLHAMKRRVVMVWQKGRQFRVVFRSQMPPAVEKCDGVNATGDITWIPTIDTAEQALVVAAALGELLINYDTTSDVIERAGRLAEFYGAPTTPSSMPAPLSVHNIHRPVG